MRARFVIAAAALAAAPVFGQDGTELSAPVRVEAGREPIDVEIGHAAPFFGDFDGDGKPDLLVGQFGGGRLRIYKNVGTKTAPKFREPFRWFDGTVPAS